jgi:hypothetical protein
MSCHRRATELLDVALGGPSSPALEAHLRSCGACRGLLEEERRRLVRIDDELRQMLRGEPSAALLPRVREVVREAAPADVGSFPRLLPLAASVVASAVVLAFALRVWRPAADGSSRLDGPRMSVAATASVAPPSARARPAPAPPALAAATRRPPARTRSAPARPPAEPEVLVPAGEEAALRGYVRAIRDQRLSRESVIGLGADPVAWTDAGATPQWSRPVDRLPLEADGLALLPEKDAPTLGEGAGG